MEVNSDYINSSLMTSVDSSTLSSSINVQALEKIDFTKENTNTFSVDLPSEPRRSELSITLKSMMDNISSAQISLRNIEMQSSILTTLKDATQTSIDSGDIKTLIDLQPSVEELMSKYNYLSSDINKNFAKYQENTDSHNYFDGILGAKPLTPADLIKAIDQQIEIISQEKQFFDDTLQKETNRSLKIINTEIEKSTQEASFKSIDFGKNTADFTSASINAVVGSVVSSQANAIPANSPKLLS